MYCISRIFNCFPPYRILFVFLYWVRIPQRSKGRLSCLALFHLNSVYCAGSTGWDWFGRNLWTLYSGPHTILSGATHYPQWKEPNSADDICLVLFNLLTLFYNNSLSFLYWKSLKFVRHFCVKNLVRRKRRNLWQTIMCRCVPVKIHISCRWKKIFLGFLACTSRFFPWFYTVLLK